MEAAPAAMETAATVEAATVTSSTVATATVTAPGVGRRRKSDRASRKRQCGGADNHDSLEVHVDLRFWNVIGIGHLMQR